MPNSMNTLILVDGSSYLFRAFHAMPALTNAQGFPTGAIYGVINMLKSLLTEYQPTHIAIVFDSKDKTFRTELYPQYKANRTETPSELMQQFPILQQIIQALGLTVLIESGVEADDVIGTLAKQAAIEGKKALIFSGDKDFAQLVNEQITVIDTMKNTRLDPDGVQTKFGIPPELFLDYLCLVGDQSDNVPGVHKVGPKTAVKWLLQYGSLAQIIQQAAEIKGKVGENLRSAISFFPLAKQLLTIKCDVDLPFTLQQLNKKTPDIATLNQLYAQLGFKAWLTDLTTREGLIVEKSYHSILTEIELNQWITKLKQVELFAFDTETTGLDYLTAKIVGLSFAITPYEAIYIPLAHDYIGAPKQCSLEQTLTQLKPLLEDPQQLKVGQNLKYDAHILANYGITLRGMAYDTMLESYVLDSVNQHDLTSLAFNYLKRQTTTFEQLAGKGKKQLHFNQINIKQASHYAAEDADVTLHLHQILWDKLCQSTELTYIFQQIEIPLIPVLMAIERHGVKIDAPLLNQQSVELTEKLQILEQQAHQLVGEIFNLNSPKQLQMILFTKLQLPVLKKTPKGEPSTALEVLEELAVDYPFPRLILEYRSLSKLKSTYTDALPQQINPQTGRIHTSYQQAVTTTGRLSSTEPNLQNIPIRTAEGRRIRQAFIAPPNYLLLSADYSQIELRIMAHLSADENLLHAFKTGQDVHKHTAAEVFNIPIEMVSSEQRRKAKAVNFGLIYGMSAHGLSKQLGIKRGEAQTYMDIYFERYPKVKLFMENTREQAKNQGFVETVFGRRLLIPEINSPHHQRRQYAERSAINAPMQGTAADIIKLAMIELFSWIKTTENDVKMILQVHDELVFEVAQPIVAEVKNKIPQIMSQVAKLKVPLLVEIGEGANWEIAHA